LYGNKSQEESPSEEESWQEEKVSKQLASEAIH
jgi:hypothetical protein